MSSILNKSILRSLALTLPFMAAGAAHASTIIDGTRIIFPSTKNEVTIKLQNVGKQPSLVKMWFDKGDQNANPDAIKVPFLIAPPVARIEAGHSQAVRVVYTGDPLPKDRESVFWFNMLDVPPKPKATDKGASLRFAFDTRIKLFFRPAGLPGSAAQAMQNLHWSVVPHGKGYALKASNASPYYVNLGGKINLVAGGSSYDAKSANPAIPNMVAPDSSAEFDLPALGSAPAAGATVQYYGINDFGGRVKLQGTVAPSHRFSPHVIPRRRPCVRHRTCARPHQPSELSASG